jgi:hypothetical protein
MLMDHSNNKATSFLRRKVVWLCLVIFLTGSLDLSSFIQGRDDPAKPEQKVSALAKAEMIIRGPERGVAGQRFTVEVYIVNSGATPLKDLEFIAKADANLTLEGKTGEQRIAVPTIAPDDLHIVRLSYTPKKAGPGAVDFTLRAPTGEKEQVSQVWPVGLAGLGEPQPIKNAGPVQLKITALKDCIVDRPAVVLIHALNTSSLPLEKQLDLVVSYASVGKNAQVIEDAAIPAQDETAKFEGRNLMKRAAPLTVANNPTRQTKVTVPVLGPGEGKTLVVRLTPRRIGDLGVAITSATPKAIANQPLATARLPVKFDPNMTAAQLLPSRAGATVPSKLPQKLADVPEVALEDQYPKGRQATEGFEHVAHLIETINHVNKDKRDAYVEALASNRSDVRGLPFRMGDDCRLSATRGQNFLTELNTLRVAMANPANLANQLAGKFTDEAVQARIAAMTQVMGPEGAQLGQQMVRYLSTLSQVDATRALAKLAIFSEEAAVRNDAVAVLANRRAKDFSDILLAGLNYPWPAVAQRAGEAIVKLKRTDMLPQLVEVLEQPDPRAPQVVEKDGKKVTVVRELVKINHLRNCLMCHSPASPAQMQTALPGEEDQLRLKGGESKRGGLGLIAGVNTLTAPVPLPGQQVPTPSPHSGYGRFSIPDTQVAIDVTYLRQDFSVKLPVADAQPWPETQRFDFVVRTREVTAKEAQAFRDLLKPAKADELSPYQSAALASLKQLTGKDAAPTADAWRRLLAQGKPANK